MLNTVNLQAIANRIMQLEEGMTFLDLHMKAKK